MPDHEKAALKRNAEQTEPSHEQQTTPLQTASPIGVASSQQSQKIATLQRLIGNRATRNILKSTPRTVQRQSHEQDYAAEEWFPVEAEHEAAAPQIAPPPDPSAPHISRTSQRIQREGGDTPNPAAGGTGEQDKFLDVVGPSSNSRWALLSEVMRAIQEEEQMGGRKGLAAKTSYIIVTSAVYCFDSSGNMKVSAPIQPDSSFPSPGYYLSVRGYPIWKVLARKNGGVVFSDFTIENAREAQIQKWVGAESYKKLQAFADTNGSDGIIMVINPGNDVDDGDTGEGDGDAGNAEWAKAQVKKVGGMISQLRKERKGAGGSGGTDPKSQKHAGEKKYDSLPDGVWHQEDKSGKQYVILTVDGALRRVEILDNETPVALLKRIEDATTALRKARDPELSVKMADGAQSTGITEQPQFGETSSGVQKPSGTGGASPAVVGERYDNQKANAAPYPARIINYGQDITVIGATNRFSMEIDFGLAGSDLLSQVTARMQPIHYYWELIDVTNVKPEARKDVGEKVSVGSNQAIRRTSGPMADLARGLNDVGEDTLNDLKDLSANPEMMVLDWPARSAWLGVMAVSDVVQIGGSLISSYISLVSMPLNERSIGFDKEGDYLIRCVATPVPSDRVPEDKRIVRASSIRAIPIRVQKINDRAKQALEEKPEDIAAMEKKLAEMKDGDEKTKLQAMLKQRQDENTPEAVTRQLKATDEKLRVLYDLESFDREKKPRSERTIEARLLDVQLQLMNIPRDEYRRNLTAQANQLAAILESTQKLGGKITGANYRPDVVLASEENGQVIKMLMMLGEGDGSKDGKRIYNLVDVTSPKTRAVYEGRSSKTGDEGHTEAIRNAFVNFRENNGYGRGTLALKLPQKLKDDLKFEVPLDSQMRSAPGSKERVMNRLRDLATAAEIAGLILAGPVGLAVGAIGGVAGAIVAVHNMSKRANGERLEWDFETIMDITAIVGGAMSLAQVGSFAAGQTKRWSKAAQKVDKGLHIFGVGMMAGQVVFIPAGLMIQLAEIDKAAQEQNLPPGEVAARRAEALLGAVKSGVVMVISASGGLGYDPLEAGKGKPKSNDIPDGAEANQAPDLTPAPIVPDVPNGPVPRDSDVDGSGKDGATAPKAATPTRTLEPTPKLPSKVTAVGKNNLIMEVLKVLGFGDLPQTGRIFIREKLDTQWEQSKGSAMPDDAIGFRDVDANMMFLDRSRMTPEIREALMAALKQRSHASRLARASLGDAICNAFSQRLLEMLFHDPQNTPAPKEAADATVDVLLGRLELAVGADVVADAMLHGTVPGLRGALTEIYGAARANAIEALIKSGANIRAALLLETPNHAARSAYGEAFSAGVEDLMASEAGGKPRNPERLGVMREIAGIVGTDTLTMALLKGNIEPVRTLLEKAIGVKATEQLITALKEGNLPKAQKSLKGEIEATAAKPADASTPQNKPAGPELTDAQVKPADKDGGAPKNAPADAQQDTPTPKPDHQLGQHGQALKTKLAENMNGDHQALAENAIKEAGSFKKLRDMVNEGLFGSTKELIEAAKNQLQKARIEMTKRVIDDIIAEVEKRYPGLKIKLEDMGTPGFGSDRDATINADGTNVDVNSKVKASAEVVDLAYQRLRELGLDPDTVLDSNFYTELHEGSIKASSPEEARAIAYDQSVVSMAEKRMQMDDAQWAAFREKQLEPFPAKEKPASMQERLEQEARQRLEQQLDGAEALVEARMGGNGTSNPAERKLLNDRRLKLLEARRRELIEMMGRNPPASPREIRALMAEVKMLEPDAYGTRAAKEGVVDTQQAMGRAETSKDAAAIWDKRQAQKGSNRAEILQRLAQEASASLAKMFGHAKQSGNSPSDVRALAKYLARVYHAFREAGLGGMVHPFIDKTGDIVATKLDALSDAATLRELHTWAQDTGMTNLSDAQLLDRFVAEAQKLGTDISTRLRAAEMMDHVMENPGDIAPKDPTPALWSKPSAPATTPDAPQAAAPATTAPANPVPQAAEPAKTSDGLTPQSAAPAVDPGQHQSYKAQLRADMQKPVVNDEWLKKIVDANYRENAKVGSGSTAAAIRHERSTGESVGGREHTQKGQDTIRALQKWLEKNPLNDPKITTAEAFSQRKNDIIAAENIIADLTDALNTPIKGK